MNLKDLNTEQIKNLKVRIVDFFIDYISPSEFAKSENITLEESTKIFQEFKNSKCYQVN
jgi:hypothetical protein